MKYYGNLSDDVLFNLIKENDEKAFSALYDRYWDKLLIAATARLNDISIAEECVQNVFIGLWKRKEQLVLRQSLAAYLAVAVKYQVIKQLGISYRNAAKKASFLLRSDSKLFSEESDHILLEKELKEQYDNLISKLPKKCRIVFTLSREEGLKNNEIASKLNISEKTVEGHITKALRLLSSDFLIIQLYLIVKIKDVIP